MFETILQEYPTIEKELRKYSKSIARKLWAQYRIQCAATIALYIIVSVLIYCLYYSFSEIKFVLFILASIFLYGFFNYLCDHRSFDEVPSETTLLRKLIERECGGISPAVIEVLRADGLRYVQELDYTPYFSFKKIISILFSICLVLFGALLTPHMEEMTIFSALVFLLTLLGIIATLLLIIYLPYTTVSMIFGNRRNTAQYLCSLLSTLQIQLLIENDAHASEVASPKAKQSRHRQNSHNNGHSTVSVANANSRSRK